MKPIKPSLASLFSFSQTDRVWQLPFFAAMSVGAVLFVGIACGRIDLALVATLGANAFLYVPNTPLYHRMAVTMCCSFGIILSFALGFLAHFLPVSLALLCVPLLAGGVSALSSMLVRYYNLPAPGYFFFAMSCVLGTFSPYPASDFVFLVGVVTLGAFVANAMALAYSLCVVYGFKNKLPSEIPARGRLGFETIVVESLIIGVAVGVAVGVGQILGLEKSYWVAISCVAIMQGATLNAVWQRQIQRILGTFVGMLVMLALVRIHLSNVELAFVMMFLMFMGELSVVRNYALAMVFFTPFTIYLAEIGHFVAHDAEVVLEARMLDTIIGSVIGLGGGFMVHNTRLRALFILLSRRALRKFRRWW